MKISYNWLKEYVDFNQSPDEISKILTSTGLEVGALENVQSIKGGLKGLFVGQVLTCEPHPNSDHLHITTVDLGRETPSQIVCGAANVAAGQKVIVADLGCVLYDGDRSMTIKKTKLRGVESNGMICAEDEIGIGTSHEGIIVLPDDAPVGQPAADYYQLDDDWVIEIDITANRADALSHWGVARDLYAWLKQNGYATSLHRPTVEGYKADNNDLPIDVVIENTEACGRYACVSLTGCDVKESPDWLKKKLSVIGLRPINNIVDITNYIMMAYGQPLHCFDADMIDGRRIVVKDKNEGKKFVTLDGEEHTLKQHDLAICNAKEPMCIAGVFGGRGSGTYETTRNVVLESAFFNPTRIRKSARGHGLGTDASFRFERGVDPNGVVYALQQAALLCKEIAGAKISMEIRDVYPVKAENPVVELRHRYVTSLIGKEIGRDTVKNIMTSLEMDILHENEEGWTVSIPTYRVDVKRPCDVVEDILRIYGYNNVEIPTQLKSSLVVKGREDMSWKLENLIGEQLSGSGFHEIVNNSLTRAAYYQGLNGYPEDSMVRIMNPLSNDLNVMRRTLLFGGLESIAHNSNRKNPDLRLFEYGNCYTCHSGRKDDNNPMKAYEEACHLGLWVTGKRVSGSWIHPNEDASFYELKAYVLNILRRIGVSFRHLTFGKSENDIFSNAMTIGNRGGKVLVEMGEVAAGQRKVAETDNPVYFAELNWTALMEEAAGQKVLYHEICKYPSVSRDLALLIDQRVDFAEIESVAYQTERKLLKSVELFDVYEGKNLPAGKKSYAVNFILQDEQKTLDDKQIEAAMNKLIASLKAKLDAELR